MMNKEAQQEIEDNLAMFKKWSAKMNKYSSTSACSASTNG